MSHMYRDRHASESPLDMCALRLYLSVERHSLAIQFGRLSKKNSAAPPNCCRVRIRSYARVKLSSSVLRMITHHFLLQREFFCSIRRSHTNCIDEVARL